MLNQSIRALLGVAAASVLLVSTASANLLVNPGFEETDLGGGNDAPGAEGWSTFGGAFTLAGSFLQSGGNSNINAFEGSQVLKVFGTAGATQEFAVNAGDLVTASAWAMNGSYDPMADGQVAAVNIEWFAGCNGPCGDGDKLLTLGGEHIISFGSTIVGETAALDVWSQIGVFDAAVAVSDTGVTATHARMVLITGPFAGSEGGAPAFDAASFTAAPVPIPAAVWLMASGLLGLAGLRRRKA